MSGIRRAYINTVFIRQMRTQHKITCFYIIVPQSTCVIHKVASRISFQRSLWLFICCDAKAKSLCKALPEHHSRILFWRGLQCPRVTSWISHLHHQVNLIETTVREQGIVTRWQRGTTHRARGHKHTDFSAEMDSSCQLSVGADNKREITQKKKLAHAQAEAEWIVFLIS